MKQFISTVTRYRHFFLYGGALLALALSLLSDPDNGLATALGGLALVQGIWAIALAHLSRKALMDYPEADWRKLFAKAGEGATGAGLALLAASIVLVGTMFVFAPRAHAGELPAGFYIYGPTLKAEQVRLWPDNPKPSALAGLIEQETCASLRSRSCWNPAARLKSSREEGAGMGQITRAFRADGSVRFDSLTAMREKYRSELGEWSWENVYSRPDLQMRGVVLMSKDAARPFRGLPGMLDFADAGYNGGIAGVQSERRACALTRGCDSGVWFDHVERHCLKSRQALYGSRNACDINREHVRNVRDRSKKYERAMA